MPGSEYTWNTLSECDMIFSIELVMNISGELESKPINTAGGKKEKPFFHPWVVV